MDANPTANPILAEMTRGNWVENRHRGAFVVADAQGNIIASAGDIERPVFPRSAIKSMQAIALITSGAIEKFNLTDEELALSCASHQGEDFHVAGVTSYLGHIGLGISDLECGAHAPTFAAAREKLRDSGQAPSAVHNNCSGKHSGMLAVAEALGVPTGHYVDRDHPVQQEVRSGIETVLHGPLNTDRCGTDGCSIPTWAAPLHDFATGFARMATGEGLPPKIAAGAKRIFDAATAHPHLVGGTGSLDTEVMKAFSGRVFQKGGAEGVQCGAIRDKGWGYALKVDDGHMSASHAMVATLLLAISGANEEQQHVLKRFAVQVICNVRGLDVGMIKATAAMLPKL
ncbi:MAG: asparaginase [Devosia sp.]